MVPSKKVSNDEDEKDFSEEEEKQESLSNASSSKIQRDQNKALERVAESQTDEETALDPTKAQQIVKNLFEVDGPKDSSVLQRERELAAIEIKSADVDFIMNELEVSRSFAEKALRENKGNLVTALNTIVNS